MKHVLAFVVVLSVVSFALPVMADLNLLNGSVIRFTDNSTLSTAPSSAPADHGGTDNTVNGTDSFVGGGYNNLVTDNFGVIGGGEGNQAGDNAGTTGDRPYATVSGGKSNTASNDYDVVGGGYSNTASGGWATVSGGEFNTASFSNTTVGGGQGNTASGAGATVGGGTFNSGYGQKATVSGGTSNSAFTWATVGGGHTNAASDDFATIGGGFGNVASGEYATVGGGRLNTASGDRGATVSGGKSNVASNFYASVTGGRSNTASGWLGTVVGGAGNVASGYLSFAAGNYANASHTQSFVWGGGTGAKTSFDDNTFNVWSSGGIYLNGGLHAASDRNTKKDFSFVSAREILDKVVEMPVTTWRFKGEDDSVRHIGPMAQDFSAAFGYGVDDTHITVTDEAGVALAAIQGLHAKLLEEKDARIQAFEAQSENVTALRWQNAQLNGYNAALEARLARLEKAILRE